MALFMRNCMRCGREKAITASIRAAMATCALAALLAGCGLQRASYGHGRHGTGAPGAGGSRSTAPARCLIGQLRVKLDTAAAGVAAGTSYLPVDFTNAGPARCALDGFPQVTIAAGRGGARIGAPASVDRSLAATAVVLGARGTAHIWIHLADVANLPTAACRPVTAAGLRVSLPGQRRAAFVSHRLTSCAKPVSGTDLMIVGPFQPGSARPGTAQ